MYGYVGKNDMYKNITPNAHLWVSLAIFLAFSLFFITPSFAEKASKESIEFVVSAIHDPIVVKENWQLTMDYLQEKLPQYQFNLTIIPIKDIDGLKQKVIEDADFIITQPAVYVQLEFELGVSRILTMVKKGGYNVFGSTILLPKNSEITDFNDLKNKTIAGIAEHGFGGWLIAKKWLLDNEINLDSDMKQVSFLGTHKKIAKVVANGDIDIGVVRTGTLEKLESTSPDIYKQLKVFKPQQHGTFSLLTSTPLYPEWALAQSHNAHNSHSEIAKDIAVTLLNLPHDSAIATTAGYSAWTLPGDYNDVHDVLKSLRFPPYDKYEKLTLSALFEVYAQELVVIVIVASLLLLLFIFYLLGTNRKLKALSKINSELVNKLERYSKELESKVDRQKKDLKLIQSNILAQDRMASLGMMLAGITHELRNPMNFILNFSKINEELSDDLKKELTKNEISLEMEEALDLCDDIKENSLLVVQNTLRADKVLQDIFLQMNQNNDNSHLDKCHVHEIIQQSVFYVKKANRYSFSNVIDPDCIKLKLMADHDKILGSLSNLTRVFINVIDNSIFSICKRQELECRKNPDHDYQPELVISSENDGNNEISILIKDNGIGVEKEIQDKVLNHFFTTKQPGEGTGLGLSISYEIIITEHKGKLSLQSEPFNYFELKITLPLL